MKFEKKLTKVRYLKNLEKVGEEKNFKKDIKNTVEIETAKVGFANGISTVKINTSEDREKIIQQAAYHFGNFLQALGCDWEKDPNSNNTPTRVAKAYVDDLWKGRFQPLGEITTFPSDGYDGMVQESNIPLTSMCSHHHQTIEGKVSIAYITSPKGKLIGLSKLNRIVEHFSKRGVIQEQLTVAIHNAVDYTCKHNIGVAVNINATHNCVKCRGVKHTGASMQTAKLSGCFLDDNSISKAEFYNNIKLSN